MKYNRNWIQKSIILLLLFSIITTLHMVKPNIKVKF